MKHCAQRVERARADVAVDDADRADDERRHALARACGSAHRGSRPAPRARRRQAGSPPLPPPMLPCLVAAAREADVELLQLAVEVRALEPGLLRDAAHVALLAAEELLEIDALERLARLAQRQLEEARGDLRRDRLVRRGGFAQQPLDVIGRDVAGAGVERQIRDDVLQMVEIAGPVRVGQRGQRARAAATPNARGRARRPSARSGCRARSARSAAECPRGARAAAAAARRRPKAPRAAPDRTCPRRRDCRAARRSCTRASRPARSSFGSRNARPFCSAFEYWPISPQ